MVRRNKDVFSESDAETDDGKKDLTDLTESLASELGDDAAMPPPPPG